MSIVIKNLSFSYSEKKILRNFSLTIENDNFVGIMGLSGSGKTTLLRVLLGLNPYEEGEVLINGIDYSKENIKSIRDLISYVPQRGALFPHLKIEENIYLPLRIKRPIESKDKERLSYLLKKCRISEEVMGRLPGQLSGGQRQRISLIRTLMTETPFVFLDEPLSALDPITKVSIQKEFRKIFTEEKKTVLMVSHSLNEVKYLCNQLAILKDGMLEQFSKTDDVLRNPGTSFVSEFIEAQK